MSQLSTGDRAYVQMKVGISSDEAVFTNAELDDLYARAGESLPRTIVECFEVLAANQAKQASYANGLQREDLSDVFQHIMAMLAYWKAEVAGSGGQARIVGLRPAPTVHREEPHTLYDPDRARRLSGRSRRGGLS